MMFPAAMAIDWAAEKVSSQESRTRGWAACALAGYHSWCWCIFIATSQKGQKDAENTWKNILKYQMFFCSNLSSFFSPFLPTGYLGSLSKNIEGNIIHFKPSWKHHPDISASRKWGMVINPWWHGDSHTIGMIHPFWEGIPMMTWD